jgi:hypothetical protein
MEYLLEKEKREIELDKQQQLKRAEREKEIARLRAAQEKVRPFVADIGENFSCEEERKTKRKGWQRKKKENSPGPRC